MGALRGVATVLNIILEILGGAFAGLLLLAFVGEVTIRFDFRRSPK